LIRPTLRAIPWRALAAAGAAGLGITLTPSLVPAPDAELLAQVVRGAAVAGALGAAFLLDDPAERTLATAPSPLLLRRVLRVALVLPAGIAWWIAVLALASLLGGAEAGMPVVGLSVEAAGLSAVALALAAVGMRGATETTGGPFAAAGLLGFLAVAARLPVPVVLLTQPGSPEWNAAHRNWLALLAVALVTFLLHCRDPARRPLPRP